MHGIPRAPGRRAYSSMGREAGAVCMERLAVFVPSLPLPLLSTVYPCDGCLSYLGRGGSWLGCQVWPAISAVSILELVTNSGSSRMSRAPNLHSLRATKLFNGLKLNEEKTELFLLSSRYWLSPSLEFVRVGDEYLIVVLVWKITLKRYASHAIFV